MLRRFFPLSPLLLVLTCLTCVSGCGAGEAGPDLAVVKGTVKMDGKPASGLLIRFEPKVGKGEASVGATDAEGKYELKYGQKAAPGAVVGEHIVRVMPASEADYTGEPIPPQFNSESKLTANVEKGKENQIPFDLKKE